MRTPLNHASHARFDDDHIRYIRELSFQHNVSLAEAIRLCIEHCIFCPDVEFNPPIKTPSKSAIEKLD